MENIAQDIEAEFEAIRDGVLRLPDERSPHRRLLRPPATTPQQRIAGAARVRRGIQTAVRHNVSRIAFGLRHRDGPLKPIGGVPGDASAS
jgi:sulfite reductase (NADPH) hemoprotein beta-component